jgi:hypothetical protein
MQPVQAGSIGGRLADGRFKLLGTERILNW